MTTTPTLVRDLMQVGVPTCAPETPVVELARLMLEKGFEGVVVLDGEQGSALGAVSQDDLVRAYAQGGYEGLTATAVMQEDIPQVPPDIPLTAAAHIMQDQGVRVLYMMHHAGGIVYPAAMLTYHHLLRHLGVQDASELSDLGVRAARKLPLETFARRRDEARRQT